MARGLYRLYLYIVFIAMLLFMTVSVSSLLGVLLRETPLQGQYGATPTGSDVVQSVTLAALTLIIAGGLAALHYWLIRRDQRDDPNAGNGAVRAFFINATEGIAALTAVLIASIALAFYQSNGFISDISGPIAAAISAALLALGLEAERRRQPATAGAAGVFQRLHLYGAQLILLFIINGFLLSVLSETEHAILQNTSYNPCVTDQFGNTGAYCGTTDLVGPWLAALIPIAAWGVYALLARRDTRSTIRAVFHVLGLSYGMIVFLIGAERAIEFALNGPFGLPTDAVTFAQSFDFPPILIFAGLAILMYALLVRADAAVSPAGPQTLGLIVQSIIAALLSAPFWFGLFGLVSLTFQSIGQGSPVAGNGGWATAVALTLMGATYIPVALNLSRRSATTGAHGPRRGFVLALLAAGALTVAGSVVTLLYALGTAALGSPLTNWQDVARNALAALVVGLALGGVYGWIAIREGVFARSATSAAPAAAQTAPATTVEASVEAVAIPPWMSPSYPANGEPAAAVRANGDASLAAPGAVEAVLDDLLANSLTRDQAAARIRELAGVGPA